MKYLIPCLFFIVGCSESVGGPSWPTAMDTEYQETIADETAIETASASVTESVIATVEETDTDTGYKKQWKCLICE